MTIVKLHGTSGSGKSTVAWTFLKQYPTQVIQDGKKVVNLVTVPDWNESLYIFGKYTTQCGGCDTLNADQQIELLLKYGALGHVLYEGLLASEYYGRLGEASAQFGNDHIFAFLDTPIETCIERVKARRLAAGNEKPLNEDNTRGRIKKIEALKRKLVNVFGRRVVTLDHTNAYEQVKALYAP